MTCLFTQSTGYAYGQSTVESSRQVLMTALMGAGTGAISAEASGGKAGTGALVGAGTQLIGSMLLQFLSPSTAGGSTQPIYYQPSTHQIQSYVPAYNASQTTSYPQASTIPTYVPALNATGHSNRDIIKNGLMGAATGAIASEVSNGKAGTGAFVGAGTQIIGSALLDLFFTPSPTQTFNTSYAQSTSSYVASAPTKKIIRKYDREGRVVSEEEFWV